MADHIEQALHDLASLATVALDVPVALITLVADEGEHLEVGVSRDSNEVLQAPRLSALLPDDHRLLLVIDDASANPRLAAHPMVAGTRGIRFYLESPILSAHGTRVGALVVYARTPMTIDARQIALVRGISNRIVAELQRRDAAGAMPATLDDERLALRSAAAVYRLLVEESGDAVVVVDGTTLRIVETNESACVLTGYAREELLQLKTSDLVLPEDVPILLEAINAIKAGGRLEATRRLRRKDGSLVWCDITSKELPDGRRLSLVRNVSERVRMEEERAAILERVTDGFIALDSDGRFTWLNEQAAATFDRVAQDIIGLNMWEEFAENISQPLRDACDKVMRTQVPIRFEDYYLPHDRWYEDRIFPSSTGVSIFFADITERKRAERVLHDSADQLRRLTQRLNDVREQEQAHLSRELHDRLGHSLTMLKLGLARYVARAASTDASAAEHAQQLNAEIDAAIDTTRQLSAELRPPMLDDFGLAAALEWAGKRFARRTGLLCHLELDECVIERHIARALYAISQEALTNVVRHASAHAVTLRLSEQEHQVCLEISDDGVGIADLARANHSGLGMLGMRERAAAVGATIEIVANAGGGTCLRVVAPAGATA